MALQSSGSLASTLSLYLSVSVYLLHASGRFCRGLNVRQLLVIAVGVRCCLRYLAHNSQKSNQNMPWSLTKHIPLTCRQDARSILLPTTTMRTSESFVNFLISLIQVSTCSNDSLSVTCSLCVCVCTHMHVCRCMHICEVLAYMQIFMLAFTHKKEY